MICVPTALSKGTMNVMTMTMSTKLPDSDVGKCEQLRVLTTRASNVSDASDMLTVMVYTADASKAGDM